MYTSHGSEIIKKKITETFRSPSDTTNTSNNLNLLKREERASQSRIEIRETSKRNRRVLPMKDDDESEVIMRYEAYIHEKKTVLIFKEHNI